MPASEWAGRNRRCGGLWEIFPCELGRGYRSRRASLSNAKLGQHLLEKRSEFRDRLSIHFLHNPLG